MELNESALRYYGKTDEGHSSYADRNNNNNNNNKLPDAENPLEASEASLELDFLAHELEEELQQAELSMNSEERFQNNSSDHDLMPVNRSRHSQAHKTEQSDIFSDAKTCSLTGSSISFHELSTVPSVVPGSAAEPPYVDSYYATELNVEEERSDPYTATAAYDKGYEDPMPEYRQPDDRWGSRSQRRSSTPNPQQDPMSSRRARVPVQKALSCSSKRCSQTELASITQPPSSYHREKSTRSRSPRRQDNSRSPNSSGRNGRTVFNGDGSWYTGEELSIAVSVSKYGSAAELASITRPDEGSFRGSGNASWVSRGDYSGSKNRFSPSNSFRGRLREEIIIQQQNKSLSNGEQELYHSQSRSDSFRSHVKEELKVRNRNGTMSPKDLSAVLNSSFQRLNNSSKARSEKGRSPNRSSRSLRHGEGISGLLDQSLKGPEDDGFNPRQSRHGEDGYGHGRGPHDSYRLDDEVFVPRSSSRSSHRGGTNRSAYSPNNSYNRSHRGEDRSAYNPNNSSRSHGRSTCNPNNAYINHHREEQPVYGRESSYRVTGDRPVHSPHNSQRGDFVHSLHNSFRGEEGLGNDHQGYDPSNQHQSPGNTPGYSRQGTYHGQEAHSPAYSQRRNGHPNYNHENSWTNNANEPQWRNRFEHNRSHFPRESSWRGGRPVNLRESSVSSRDGPHDRPTHQRELTFNGGRPMYQRDSSFASRDCGRSAYDREPSFESQIDDQPVYQRDSSFRGQSRGSEHPAYERECSFNNRHQPSYNGQGPWVDRTPSNISSYTQEVVGVHYSGEEMARTATNPSAYSRESTFSSVTREPKRSSIHREHPPGRRMLPRSKSDCAPSGRRLPSRSKSDYGGRHSRQSRSFGEDGSRATPSRFKSDTSELSELSKSVTNSYATRGGGEGEDLLVEILPGVEVPLRSAHETPEAVSNNFCMPVSCMACSNIDLYAIADVAYFVCPACKSMCNVEEECFNGRPVVRHGLGLGFTSETLFSMQAEIMGASSPVRAQTAAPERGRATATKYV